MWVLSVVSILAQLKRVIYGVNNVLARTWALSCKPFATNVPGALAQTRRKSVDLKCSILAAYRTPCSVSATPMSIPQTWVMFRVVACGFIKNAAAPTAHDVSICGNLRALSCAALHYVWRRLLRLCAPSGSGEVIAMYLATDMCTRQPCSCEGFGDEHDTSFLGTSASTADAAKLPLQPRTRTHDFLDREFPHAMC